MNSALLGGFLGLMLAIGVILAVRAAPPMRPVRLVDRMAPYLGDTPVPSKLLERPSAASAPFRTGRAATGSVTARALQVLDAFAADHAELTVSEIARRAGMPLSTAHRLVGDLAAGGALERNDTGRYRIGLRLWEIASLAPRGLGLREVAMPFMEDLYE